MVLIMNLVEHHLLFLFLKTWLCTWCLQVIKYSKNCSTKTNYLSFIENLKTAWRPRPPATAKKPKWKRWNQPSKSSSPRTKSCSPNVRPLSPWTTSSDWRMPSCKNGSAPPAGTVPRTRLSSARPAEDQQRPAFCRKDRPRTQQRLWRPWWRSY